MGPLDAVGLTRLMDRASGRPVIKIGVIDGPVLFTHPDLFNQKIEEIPEKIRGTCLRAESAACLHGTFVAGILCARRGSSAPAICPGCQLLVRPIFSEMNPGNGDGPSATPEELAEAIIDCVRAGARVLNLSAALAPPSWKGMHLLVEALNFASSREVILVAAAGNQGTIGSSAITRHPSVIPVTACDLQGRPLRESNLGRSIATRGLMAPGVGITSLGIISKPQTLGGTSAAAPFVTGAIALLWSVYPGASAVEVRLAITQHDRRRRASLVPPMLDAWSAYQAMSAAQHWREVS